MVSPIRELIEEGGGTRGIGNDPAGHKSRRWETLDIVDKQMVRIVAEAGEKAVESEASFKGGDE